MQLAQMKATSRCRNYRNGSAMQLASVSAPCPFGSSGQQSLPPQALEGRWGYVGNAEEYLVGIDVTELRAFTS